jgi:hypothetical protein
MARLQTQISLGFLQAGKGKVQNMEENTVIVIEGENWKTKVLLIGGAVGLLAGLGAAYLLIQRSDRDDSKPVLNLVEGVKLGLLVLGMMRQISQLGEGK